MDYGMKTRKRNGSIVDFDKNKIFNAIEKAVMASHVDEAFDSKVCNKLVDTINDECFAFCQKIKSTTINIEDIQDIVERTLIKNGFADTAKEYILYRQKRNEIRNTRDSITNTISTLLNTESYENDLKRDNGNIDGDSPMGTMLQIGSNVSKNYYLNNMISKDIAQAYTDGFIHIHDLDFYALTLTCCQIDCLKLFKDGFNTGHGHLREPNSIGSYATLAAIAIQSNQNDQHGGQAIPNFDYAMAPGIYKTFRKVWNNNVNKAIKFGLINSDINMSIKTDIQVNYDNSGKTPISITDEIIDRFLGRNFAFTLVNNANHPYDGKEDKLFKVIKHIIKMTIEDTERQCYQAMEGIVHNLNTLHSRAGAQVPFSSINLGTDTSNAGRMITKNLLLAMEAGLGHGETAIFPIVIFKVKEGVNYNPEDPNYDLLQLSYRVTAKRLFPNYVFEDATFNKQYYKQGHPETEVCAMGKLNDCLV